MFGRVLLAVSLPCAASWMHVFGKRARDNRMVKAISRTDLSVAAEV